METKQITSDELRKILRAACKEAGSQRKWALDNNISPAYVNDVLNGVREPAEKIGKALGYKKMEHWIIRPKPKPKGKKDPMAGIKYDEN